MDFFSNQPSGYIPASQTQRSCRPTRSLAGQCLRAVRVFGGSVTIWLVMAAGVLDLIPASDGFAGVSVERISVRRIAQAQQTENFTDLEIGSYAQSVLDLEAGRMQAVNAIESLPADLPDFTCEQARRNVRSLDQSVRKIVVDYCNQATTVIKNNGLDVSTFNQITQELAENPTLEQQIQAELLRLQGAASN
ncbi:MAG: DUF4168 domain-containing protein [Microcoleaceae cyanobacterium]